MGAAFLRATTAMISVINRHMEIGILVFGWFAIGVLAYGVTQLSVALRDLRRAWLLRRRPVCGLANAGEGPVTLRGRAVARKLLSPPSGGEALVAWKVRGVYGYGDDAEHVPFELRDGALSARVEPAQVALLTPERTDKRGWKLRAVEPETEVLVSGWLERDTLGGLRLRDVPGQGVVIAAGPMTVLPNLARAALAFVAFAIFAVTVVIAHSNFR